MEAELDLSVKFIEPTVGGLTGAQLSLFRQYEEENRCEADIFPVSPKGPAERCLEPKAENSSRFCEEHLDQWLWENTYDEYDSWRDRDYEG